MELCQLLVEAYVADKLQPSDETVSASATRVRWPAGCLHSCWGKVQGGESAAGGPALHLVLWLPPPWQVRRLLALVDAFPLQGRQEGADPPVQECASFVSAAVKWLRR